MVVQAGIYLIWHVLPIVNAYYVLMVDRLNQDMDRILIVRNMDQS